MSSTNKSNAENNHGAFQYFLDAVNSGDDNRTEEAVSALTAADEEALVLLLDSDEPDQQWWAVRALAMHGSATALPSLLDLLTEKTDIQEIQLVTIMTIGAIVPRQPAIDIKPYIDALAATLAAPDGMVRQVAADTLAQCGEVALPALVELLRFGTDQGARSRAAYALGRMGMAAAPALYHCLNDDNYLVHTYAYEALDTLGLLENELFLP